MLGLGTPALLGWGRGAGFKKGEGRVQSGLPADFGKGNLRARKRGAGRREEGRLPSPAPAPAYTLGGLKYSRLHLEGALPSLVASWAAVSAAGLGEVMPRGYADC